jgi:hypothetical protein
LLLSQTNLDCDPPMLGFLMLLLLG